MPTLVTKPVAETTTAPAKPKKTKNAIVEALTERKIHYAEFESITCRGDKALKIAYDALGKPSMADVDRMRGKP